MTERITISVPDDLAEEINDQLSYGDNRSEWIREAIEQRLSAANEPTETDSRSDTSPTRTHETDDLREQLRGELAGSGDLLDRRVDEVFTMYDHLQEHGSAEKDDLLDVVDVEATGYQDEDSVWSNMIKGKDTLRSLPGVETPATGMTTWRYTGPI